MGKVAEQFPYMSFKIPIDDVTASKGLKWLDRAINAPFEKTVLNNVRKFYFMGFFKYYGNGYCQYRPVFRVVDKAANYFDYYFTKPNDYDILDCSYTNF